MATSDSDRQSVITQFQIAQQKAQALETALRIDGKNQDADRVAAETERLSDSIDALIGRAMEPLRGFARHRS